MSAAWSAHPRVEATASGANMARLLEEIIRDQRGQFGLIDDTFPGE
jgi:hypothetical protein